jgi:RNA polymerase sigma-54 factor
MAIGPRLDLRQSQSLVMTPQLRQAIKLLQYTNLEVAAFVDQELERNPLLERDERSDEPGPERAAPDQQPLVPAAAEPDAARAGAETLPDAAREPLDVDWSNSYDAGGTADGMRLDRGGGGAGGRAFEEDDRGIEDLPDARPPLREYLGEQLRLTFTEHGDRMIGAHLIALLCPAGRLTADPANVAAAMKVPLERVEAVRARMMRFDPPGLFARDLKECLAAQLAELNRLDPAMRALLDNLDLLAKRELRRLMAICGVDSEDLADMIGEIKALDPKPAASWEAEPARAIVPDVLMRPSAEGGWLLEVNPDTLPRVLVNHRFYTKVAPGAAKETRGFLAEQLASANWLVKSLHQRTQTILKVAAEIVRQQDAFLKHGITHLKPLILRDIAAAVDLHESTVSRVTANKYIATPRGLFELKYFFTTAIARTDGGAQSAEAVRHRIKGMIAAEDPERVLSDEAIVDVLRSEGVDIARRTVAKYREALRIPNSTQRKREKAVPA